MTTDYDPIAEQYQRSKQQPWRTHIEAFSLLQLAGDTRGQHVLDVACGEGFYTRQLKHPGTASVTGLDLSASMIELARTQEAAQQLGIHYVVGDARQLPYTETFDLVVAAYLLNYAHDRQELQTMCDSIARCLKPGGRFVTVNSSPALDFSRAPSYRSYGFEIEVVGAFGEGAPLTWRFHLEDGTFSLENYYLDTAIHESALRAAGFREVQWPAPRLSPAALAGPAAEQWELFLAHSPVAFLECRK